MIGRYFDGFNVWNINAYKKNNIVYAQFEANKNILNTFTLNLRDLLFIKEFYKWEFSWEFPFLYWYLCIWPLKMFAHPYKMLKLPPPPPPPKNPNNMSS